MNFAVENLIQTPKPSQDNSEQVAEVADMILTRAFLGTEQIDSSTLREEKGRVTVRIEQVFQSKTSLYVHYAIVNHSARPYRVTTPKVLQALAPQVGVSLSTLRYKQLDEKALRKLGELTERQLASPRAENKKEDLQPGELTHGVMAIREQFATPTILRLTFGSEGSHAVQATLVL